MPRSKPTRTLKKAPPPFTQRTRRKARPVMFDPEVEHVPDSELYPGGGLIIRYKDTEGCLHREIFSSNDHIAFSKKWLSVAVESICPGRNIDVERLMNVDGLEVGFAPPKHRDRHLYRTFQFSPSLWIRVWDPNLPIPPGGVLDLFGVDIVDVSGQPQAVNTRVQVSIGVRPPHATERPGDIVTALDDVGVRMDRFDLIPSRYPVAADLEYVFKDGKH
ncbi:hypothetical protein IW262DRAFT_1353502 [Armillaria fumosa]|nr:hypothetical protein IW262DRAFT_1353502 [Armillaria fumosa]